MPPADKRAINSLAPATLATIVTIIYVSLGLAFYLLAHDLFPVWINQHQGLILFTLSGLFVWVLVWRHQRGRFEDRALCDAMIDACPMAVYAVDFDGKVLSWNQAAADIFGWAPEEVIGKPLPIVPDEDEEEVRQIRRQLANGRSMSELDVTRLRKDGSSFQAKLYMSPIADADGDAVALLAVLTDVTSSKLMESERERLFTAIEQSGEAIVITDAEGTIEYVNEAFETLSGYSRYEVLGRYAGLLANEHQGDAFYRAIRETISSGRSWRGRIDNKRKDGSTANEMVLIRPITSPGGEVTGYISVQRDITHEIELEHQLNQAQKMEMVGRLAGGIAHDYNNMLGVVLGYTEMMMENLEETSAWREDLEEIQAAARRSTNLTRKLLAFAREQMIEPQAMNLNDTMESMLKMLERLIGEDVRLLWQPGHDLMRVFMDPTQVDQVMANLVINARDAIEGQGTVVIEMRNVHVTDIDARERRGLEPGRYVLLTVSDTGKGMDQDTVSRIFEPFFTTKPVGSGTGLGLSTVYGIVKQNDGYIYADSQVGQGTTFRLYLPVYSGDDVGSYGEKESSSVCGGSECILLVEDEQALLKLAERMLKKLGYQVVALQSPERAVALLRDTNLQPDLLLTDVVMPEMSGVELYREARRQRPGLSVLFTSGYSEATSFPLEGFAERVPFIRKPYSIGSLSAKVRSALEIKETGEPGVNPDFR